MNTPAQNKKGFVEILVVVLVVVLIGAGAYLFFNSQKATDAPESGLGSLPEVTQRVNPAPTGKNTIYMTSVAPGNSILIDEVSLDVSGYVVISMAGVGNTRSVVGKSKLLDGGHHTRITVNATVSDGDVITVGLQDVSGQSVKDENGNPVELLFNVGMLSGHNNDYY